MPTWARDNLFEPEILQWEAIGDRAPDPAPDRHQLRLSAGTARQALKVVFAGGGTGGHLFPGIAMAQEFEARNPATRIIFISTGNPMEVTVLSKANYELHRISAAGIKGRGIWNQIQSVLKIPTGIWQSIRILHRFSPDLAVGLGSYSAGPVIIGAWLRGIPTVLHEQNILPGITNRILSRFAKRVYVSFKNTQFNRDTHKVHWMGNPVRRDLLEYSGSQIPEKTRDNRDDRFTVLIIGGSQGAHRINMAVTASLANLPRKDNWYFIHQTGEADRQQVEDVYRQHDVDCRVQAFFDNMAELYHRADLVVCRAGATTVAEITALGKAVIFIPFPFAADNHQALNAGSLCDANAAEMIVEKDLDPEILSRRITYYAAHREALLEMAAKAKTFGNPKAAQHIVDDCYRLIEAH
jgi:UDP-N-acetylglucosamine--N-acetylmuramyl-(pentapeptide) pyrophosphoryl-undecaprenol N-acetylglucosamine transferase